MSVSDDKASIFLRNIGEEAQRQRELLEEEIKLFLDKERKETEREATALGEAYLKREKVKILADLNREYANQLAVLRSELSDIREKMVEDIFEDLMHKLSEFVLGADYPAYLTRGASKLVQLYKGKPVVFFVRPQDLCHSNLLLSHAPAGSSVREDLSIKIGGIRAETVGTALCSDLSLDSALEEARQNFYKSNPLFNTDQS